MNKKSIQLSVGKENLKLSYLDNEVSTAKIILYLHGAACAKEDFSEAYKQESLKDFRIISVDMPGCGESEYSNNILCDIKELTEMSFSFIEALELNNICLVGHSTGGMVALKLLQNWPQKFVGFISVEGNIHPDNGRFSDRVVKSSFVGFENQLMPKLIEELGESDYPGFNIWAEHLKSKKSQRAFYDVCPSLVKETADVNNLDFYKQLKIPKLYIYGSENKDKFKFLSEFTERVEISNAHHFPFYDNPEAFYHAVGHFIRTLK